MNIILRNLLQFEVMIIRDYGKFEAILASNMLTTFNCDNNKLGLEKIDEEFCNKINFYEDVDELVNTVFSCITAVCNKAFNVSRLPFQGGQKN